MSPWRFGPFELDPTLRRLLRDGTPVAITARVFDILVALVEHAGRPVDKDVLLQRVWGDVTVEEGNLTRNVSTLRKILGDSPDDHQYIVTLPGRGYQFVAEVRSADQATAPAPPASSPSESGRAAFPFRRALWTAAGLALTALTVWMALPRAVPSARGPSRLVVLPFKNLGWADDDYFSQGMTEEITTRLSAVPDLRVISRTSGDRYERPGLTVSEIGKKLDVDYLLEGSVRWDHDADRGRLRVTAQLIRVADDTHVWATTYDRQLENLFDVQSDLARNVVLELRGALAPELEQDLDHPPTSNIEAYHAFVKGTFFARLPDPSEPHMLRIVAQFQRAVEIDSNFTLAYAALARAHESLFRFAYDISDERKAMATRALERAEALSPDSPAVLVARSRYSTTIGRDPERAVSAAIAAVDLRPHDSAVVSSAANSLMMVGRWAAAAEMFERARQLDARQAGAPAQLGLVYTALRQYSEAELVLDRAIDIEPDQLLANVLRVWNTTLWHGDLARSRRILDRLSAFDDWRAMELRFLQALYERRFAKARQEIAGHEGRWMLDWVLSRPFVLFEAQAWRLEGERSRALVAFEQARELLQAAADRAPEDGRVRSSLAIALAGLDRSAEAREQGREALRLMPFAQGFDTAAVREDVALAYTMIGDRDEALDEIETLLLGPAFFSRHLLRLDPRWDPLRTHPRYAALAAAGPRGTGAADGQATRR
jgi:DNA-binding winged helix-turn-helix (wHTH) protein/TolB-like protein/Flp pilus assembly protein TadD